jgi:transposase InsO family protein
MCELLNISRSSFYSFLSSKTSKRKIWRNHVLQEIKVCHNKSRKTYGSPRISKVLNSNGVKVSEVTVARMMKENEIRSIVSKKFKVTTNSNHKETISPNLLNRNFNVSEPSKSWISDITYIRTQEGWMYLTSVIDLYDRKVIGYSVSDKMDAKNTIIKAFQNALNKRSINKNTIFHSDRGIQYASKEFRKILNLYTKHQSMSRKGNCWDNAVAESFFSSFKKECIRKKVFYSKEKAKEEIISYIKWYNCERIHSSLNYLSPLEYEVKYRLMNVA